MCAGGLDLLIIILLSNGSLDVDFMNKQIPQLLVELFSDSSREEQSSQTVGEDRSEIWISFPENSQGGKIKKPA